MTNLKEAFQRVVEGRDLNETEAHEAMLDLMAGNTAPELVGAFLVALRMKREKVDEIVGFARAMREMAVRLHPRVQGRLIDTCGTGGARFKTFNVSTASAFVAAADGVPVAKHGNRSTTRPSGSADVLEALGVDLNLPPASVEAVIEEVGIGFLFAPAFHPAMKHAVAPRRALGIRTVFNLLGPLTNPAGARGQVLGVADPALLNPIAQALKRLGADHAYVVHGPGLDEVSPEGATDFVEVKEDFLRQGTMKPQDLGVRSQPVASVSAMPPKESADEMRRILGGGGGPRADFVALNAGLALTVAGRVKGPSQGVARAKEILASGAALQKLDAFVASTRKERPL